MTSIYQLRDCLLWLPAEFRGQIWEAWTCLPDYKDETLDQFVNEGHSKEERTARASFIAGVRYMQKMHQVLKDNAKNK